MLVAIGPGSGLDQLPIIYLAAPVLLNIRNTDVPADNPAAAAMAAAYAEATSKSSTTSTSAPAIQLLQAELDRLSEVYLKFATEECEAIRITYDWMKEAKLKEEQQRVQAEQANKEGKKAGPPKQEFAPLTILDTPTGQLGLQGATA